MAKLHELLAAEKTPNSAWSTLYADTLKKFGNPAHFFEGHSKTLKMLEESAANEAVEAQARDEKPVVTTVYDTLQYALGVYAKAEDLQAQKNKTNQAAKATVMFRGAPLLEDMPVDELLGLESRLGTLRQLMVAVPTLDATKHWERDEALVEGVYKTKYPEETTKTEKTLVPITLKEATDKHPAQVQTVNKDSVIGKFTTVRYSGAATAQQKAEAIKLIDELMVEIKQARMRANETEVVDCKVANTITSLILEVFK